MAAQPVITDHTSLISASTSKSISTASGNDNKYPYDVFINHHTDLKKTLASQFHYGLIGHGFRVFESNEADNLTCEMEGDIKRASVHIAIFSARYAESVCCLNELLVMLESGSSIIPVFYDVEPSHLRYAETGVFAEALRILGQRYNSSTVGKWRKALSDTADISGVVLEACNGDEVMLLEKVVNRVFESLKYLQGYDVIINHRGPDVKKTLASHLYNRLSAHDLRIFLDREELREGQKFNLQIEAAIQSASERYAESSWCLNELVQMLESRSTLIPVFYGVRPSDLRCTAGENGVYVRSLRTLEQKHRYDSDCIEKWRNALSHVREDDGFQLEACNGDEGQLVEQVVRRVLRKVRRTRLNEGLYLVGLDERLEDFERKTELHQQSDKARIFGIVGLGGVGKTTLAKEFFDRNRSNYDRCCFLSNVRGNSLNLKLLQSRLLKDLTQRTVQVDSIDEGIEKLKMYHSSLDALIILDDVSDSTQLDALYFPLKDVLNSGSLILVTSRDRGVFKRSRIEKRYIYMLRGLDEFHSTELFCVHAFGGPYYVTEGFEREGFEREGLESVVLKFVRLSYGLPLCLRMFGMHLQGINDYRYWLAYLYKFDRNIFPGKNRNIFPEEVQGMLKPTFDGLPQEEKYIFLDIACFFIGKDKDATVKIWDEKGLKGLLGFQNLQNKKLVEIDSQNCIQMHDHLIDLGRELAKELKIYGKSMLTAPCPTADQWQLDYGFSDLSRELKIYGNSLLTVTSSTKQQLEWKIQEWEWRFRNYKQQKRKGSKSLLSLLLKYMGKRLPTFKNTARAQPHRSYIYPCRQ